MIKNIILDPGHGGLTASGVYTTAPGKMFKFKDGTIAYEGVLNRQIASMVSKFLKENGAFNVVSTVACEDPTDVSLGDRVKVANKFKSSETIYISIHCNAGGGTGFEIFTTKGSTRSDLLAEYIATSVESYYKQLGLKLRYDYSDGDKDKEEDFYVIRKTKCPAVLLECGFFDNEKDFALLSNKAFQEQLGYKIYLGILDFVNA